MGVACSMKIHSALISLIASAFIVGHTHAEPKQGWELAFYLGTSFSKNETLTIKQDGYTDITLDLSSDIRDIWSRSSEIDYQLDVVYTDTKAARVFLVVEPPTERPCKMVMPPSGVTWLASRTL